MSSHRRRFNPTRPLVRKHNFAARLRQGAFQLIAWGVPAAAQVSQPARLVEYWSAPPRITAGLCSTGQISATPHQHANVAADVRRRNDLSDSPHQLPYSGSHGVGLAIL